LFSHAILRRVGSCCLAAIYSGVVFAAGVPTMPGNVDAARLKAADQEPQNWFTADGIRTAAIFLR